MSNAADDLTAKPICGWLKLFHPAGPLVTFPLLDVSPIGAMAAVTAYLDAGWLAYAPGLEAGEEREEIGWCLRTFIDKQGEVTPSILLYPANDAMKFSILRVYLNTEE